MKLNPKGLIGLGKPTALRPYAPDKGVGDPSLLWDLDFTTQTYRYLGAPYASVTDLPLTTFTRAGTGFGINAAGLLVSFASGAPRITDAGLTAEGAATNYVFPSVVTTLPGGNNKWNANWNGTPSAIVPNDRIAPNGMLAAAKITTAANSEGLYFRSTNLPAANAAWTYGIWVYALVPLTFTKNVNHSGGAAWTDITNAPEAVPAGVWTRLNLTRTAAASVTATSVTYSVTVPLAGTEFWVWGGQGEPGASASSNIETTTVPVTRPADVLVSNDNSPPAYTVLAEFVVPASARTYSHLWDWDDGTVNNRVFVYLDRTSGRLWATVTTGGVTVAALDLGIPTVGTLQKVAFRVAANDFAASRNGATPVTDASGAVPATPYFRRGCNIYGQENWDGLICRIRRYSVGKINADLQTMTAA